MELSGKLREQKKEAEEKARTPVRRKLAVLSRGTTPTTPQDEGMEDTASTRPGAALVGVIQSPMSSDDGGVFDEENELATRAEVRKLRQQLKGTRDAVDKLAKDCGG